MALTPLDASHQAIFFGPNQPHIAAAIGAAGITFTNCNVGGWLANDVPGAHAIIDNPSAWLPFAQATALQALTDKFNAVRDAGRVIGQKTYQLDDVSVSAMQGYWNNNVWPIQWITMDNSTISLTQVQFQNGAQNILQYVRAMRANKLSLKNQINAAPDIATLNAIDINSGWPANP